MRFTPFWSRTVRSVQRGTITLTSPATTNTATLSTSVVTTKAVVLFGGNTSNASLSGGGSASDFTRLELTNATTVTATRASTVGDVIIAYQVVEYY